ncbi:MAG: helicase-exonuclease AddAB subunit AddA [Clostridia bacterium]|nr:helicase-exonuclease AddAB subunit AddA [Clostridia bacterium]
MWTKDQSNAIYAPVGDLLVTAAAGSGKTAVMVERIINRIVGDNPTDVDRMLVVTYTNAAAAEIKERIMTEIIKKLDEKEDHNLKRQLVLLNNASICTIHSFCLDVVRSNFNELGVDPNVKIGNTNDLDIYMQKAVDKVMENHYEANDAGFLRLVRAYSGKTDEGLASILLKIYHFSRSIPNSTEWLDSLTANEAGIRGKYLSVLLNEAKTLCRRSVERYDKILRICETDNHLKGFTDRFLEEREPAYNALHCDRWNSMHDALQYKFKTLSLKRGKNTDIDIGLCEYVKQLRDEGKEFQKKVLSDVLTGREEDIISDMLGQNVYIEKLVELVKEISEEYTAIKTEKSVIDFSDFEHLCLRALSDNGNQSEAAVKVMNRFDEIYIDEYQDCNTIQEEIFRLISGANKGKPNVFVVGDMKQSIYKFRDANPQLIKAKSDNYDIYTPEEFKPRSKIMLNMNFRSRPEVLSCVNSIFRQLMTVGAGELDYTENEFLYNGCSSYTETISDNLCTDVVIIEGSSGSSDANADLTDREEYGSLRSEAVYIAERIRQMIDDPDYSVFDKKIGVYRHIEYRDIVILMRSIKSNTNAFNEVFERAGIPLFTDVKGYFESREISFIMDLLRIIDNPSDDIPLAAVMRHPVIGFDDNELMHIRGFSRKSSFYKALNAACDAEWSGRKKCVWFLMLLKNAYEKSRYMSVNELLGYIIEEIDYMTYLGTLDNAETAKSNVKMLFYKAKAFENNNFRGIFNFVNYIELIRNHSGDDDSAKTLGENDNVVRVMSIHKSKGLEFPVVFLAKTSTGFNTRDLSSSVIMHKDLGIALKIVDLERRVTYPSAARKAMRIIGEAELLSEELRVLYVALTRAREKLIITSYVSDAGKKISEAESLLESQGEVISSDAVLSAKSFIDWILMAVLRNPTCELETDISKSISDGSCFKCTVVAEENLTLTEHISRVVDFDEAFDCTIDEEISRRLEYVYPHARLASVPRNISVTELKRMAMGESEDAGSIFRKAPLQPPEFIKDTGTVTGARRGTVIHMIMQKLDFTSADYDGVVSQLQELRNNGSVTDAELESVDPADVSAFAASPLGRRITENYQSFSREFSFKYMMKAEDIYPDIDCEDEIIVQGIIDAFFEDKDGRIVLIDYKTDRITTTGADIAERYRAQLKYYSIALEKLLGKPVSECYIYLFDNGETIKM